MMEKMEDARMKIETRPKHLPLKVSFEQFQKFMKVARESEPDESKRSVDRAAKLGRHEREDGDPDAAEDFTDWAKLERRPGDGGPRKGKTWD